MCSSRLVTAFSELETCCFSVSIICVANACITNHVNIINIKKTPATDPRAHFHFKERPLRCGVFLITDDCLSIKVPPNYWRITYPVPRTVWIYDALESG